MTTAERDARIAELKQRDTELRDAIQLRTTAARQLNVENKTLMQQRQEVRHTLHALQHVKVEDSPANGSTN